MSEIFSNNLIKEILLRRKMQWIFYADFISFKKHNCQIIFQSPIEIA